MGVSQKHVPHLIGIDCGQRSQGVAILETDESGSPVSLLNGVSYIHDAGVLKEKTKTSRMADRGVKRRARRRLVNRRRRLRSLDHLLDGLGYVSPEGLPGDAAWSVRARLASEPLPDGQERNELMGLALRHMARHRGARSAWIKLPVFLRSDERPSPAMTALLASAQLHDCSLTEGATQAQCVMAHPNLDSLRLRATHLSDAAKQRNTGLKEKDKEQAPPRILEGRFASSDILHELRCIAQRQGIQFAPGSDLYRVAECIFFMEDPRTAAKERVAKDPLDPTQRRCFRASDAFQGYRIAGALAHLTIQLADEAPRRLTAQEMRNVFEVLNTWASAEAPTWDDVADVLDVPPIALRGINSLGVDGEPLTSSRAPFNTTNARLQAPQVPDGIRNWWLDATPAERDALVTLLNNSEGEGTAEDDAAASLIASLPEDEDGALVGIKLEADRSAYSARTCLRLTERMLIDGLNPYEARRAVFGIAEDWQPPAPPLHEPTGNGAVDRILMNIQRVLDLSWMRYGAPTVVNIEHVRDGFSAPTTVEARSREAQIENSAREAANAQFAQQVRDIRNLGADAYVSSSDIRRIRLLERQNSKCGYCQEQLSYAASELDHIVPRKGPGSTNRESNLMVACAPCNQDKGNKTFSSWAANNGRGVTMEAVLDGVATWTLHNLYTGPLTKARPGAPLKSGKFKGMTPYQRQHEQYRANVAARLQRQSYDEADERPLESTAYMARELRRRIVAYYEAKGVEVQVGVYQGALTAAARRAAGIEKKITMIGGRGKQRFDRRHHVIDAATIALMRPAVCTVLTQREQLRTDEKATGRPTNFERWDGSANSARNARLFYQWLERMEALVAILDDALDSDIIAVRRDLRLTLKGNPAHQETLDKLDYVPVGAAFTPEMILRASTPQLWHALVNQHDYSEDEGLAADVSRTLRVAGQELGSSVLVPLFPGNAAGKPTGKLMVRRGHGYSLAGGDAIHHARVYRMTSAKGKISYGMVRVLASDLSRKGLPSGHNPVTRPLTEDMISVRSADSKVRSAVMSGGADLLGHLFVGDEILLQPGASSDDVVAELQQLTGGPSRWYVTGFEDWSRVNLRPLLLSQEGVPGDIPQRISVSLARSWRVSIGVLFSEHKPTIIRRDTLGVPRTGKNPLRTGWHLKSRISG